MRYLMAGCLLALFAGAAASQEGAIAKNLAITPKKGALAGVTVYKNSHALLIGINDYPNMPGFQLRFATNDVRAMAEVLVKHYGFAPGSVRVLTNEAATLANIRNELARLADKDLVGPDDRILIYFSGHGQTVKLFNGGEMGFLIPSDARVNLNDFTNAAPYLASCLPMEGLWQFMGPSPAKHILLIADACYSGLLTTSRGRERISADTLAALSATPARQVMTAGGKGQVSVELSNLGHGAFTAKLLERLRARAQNDDVFLASELFGDLQIPVLNLTGGKQQPTFGWYQTEGDFLFIPVAYTGALPAGLGTTNAASAPAAAPGSLPPPKSANPPSVPAGAPKLLIKKQVYNAEITVPEGWKFTLEAFGLGSLRPEANETAGIDERIFMTVRVRPNALKPGRDSVFKAADRVTPQMLLDADLDRLLERADIIDRGKSEKMTRKDGREMWSRTIVTRLRTEGKPLLYRTGIYFSEKSHLAEIDITYPNPETYRRYEKDVAFLLDTLRFVGE